MIPVLSVENMRKSDAAAIAGGVPGRELMGRAGRGIYEAAEWKDPVAVLCGSGNNGGDGFVLATLLKEAGKNCTVFLLSDRMTPDGAYWAEKCRDAGVPMVPWQKGTDLKRFATAADCLLGTGFRGEVRETVREAIEAMNASGATLISVDINSGLNGDNGLAECCVQSDLTVSVGGFKTGHFLNMAKDVIRRKVNCDIGIEPVEEPAFLVEEKDLRALFTPRKNFAHKGSYGYTSLIGGSLKYSGAIRLAALAGAAMRAGAGVVKTALPASLAPAAAASVLEATLFPMPDRDGEMVFDADKLQELTGNIRSAAFGMGIGVSAETGEILLWLLDHFSGTLVVDADGLNLLAGMERDRWRKTACRLVLTPHLKEFSRLSQKSIPEIQQNPVEAAKSFARETGTVVLLKGPATVITDGNKTLLTDTGCGGMATAGSGDVLSGILAALCGWIPDPLTAAAAGAWINGRAGERAQVKHGSISMTAGDTAARLGEIIRELETGESREENA